MKSCYNCIHGDKRIDEYPCVECHGYSEYEEMTEMPEKEIHYVKLATLTRKDYADYVYDIVRLDCEGMDSIYKDYIIQMVGVYGFNALHEFKMIENCGMINGRQLYVLCEKTE